MRKPRVNRSERRQEISALLRRLAFSQTALHLCADEGSAAQEEFLLRVLKSEAANREEVRKARYLREAGFPVYKTLEGYEYQNLRLPPNLSRADLAAGAFIKDKKNLVLYGPVGTGKTHLATALGVLACERGRPDPRRPVGRPPVGGLCRRDSGKNARLDPEGRASDPGRMGIRADRQARRAAAVPDHLRQLRKEEPDHHDKHGVFEMGIDLHRRPDGRSDDRPPGHHGHILLFEGESYRMKHALMRQKH